MSEQTPTRVDPSLCLCENARKRGIGMACFQCTGPVGEQPSATPAALLPCPFCGGPIDRGTATAADLIWYSIECQSCGAKIEEGDESQLETAWNRRITPKPDDIAEGLRERIARIVDPMAFKNLGALYEYCIACGDSEADARKVAEDTHKPECDKAMAKADCILAAVNALPQLLADRATASGEGPVLVSREKDEDCGCPEEYWDAYGLSIHMHLSDLGSNAHADGGDWGEAEIEVRASTPDLTRAAIFGWARALTAPPASLPASQPVADGGGESSAELFARLRRLAFRVETEVGMLEDDDASLLDAAQNAMRDAATEIAILIANAERSEQHRNDLADKVTAQSVEIGAHKAQVATLTARLGALEGALKYYAADMSYTSFSAPGHIYVLDDRGKFARAALASDPAVKPSAEGGAA